MSVADEVLSAIADDGGLTSSDIADTIGRPVPSTRRTLLRLERDGLIYREVGPPATWFIPVEVPQLIGLLLDEAIEEMEASGLKWVIRKEFSDEEEDTVTDQDPDPYSVVPAGHVVRLTVAKPDEELPPPPPAYSLKGGPMVGEGPPAVAWASLIDKLYSRSSLGRRGVRPAIVAHTINGPVVVPFHIDDGASFEEWATAKGIDDVELEITSVYL